MVVHLMRGQVYEDGLEQVQRELSPAVLDLIPSNMPSSVKVREYYLALTYLCFGTIIYVLAESPGYACRSGVMIEQRCSAAESPGYAGRSGLMIEHRCSAAESPGYAGFSGVMIEYRCCAAESPGTSPQLGYENQLLL